MATTQRAGTPRTSRSAPDVVTVMTQACGTGALVAVIGVALTLIIAVATWALAPHGADSSPEVAVRMAAGLWLLAHHVALDLRSGSLALTPLGLMLVPIALTYAGSRQLARTLSPESLSGVLRAVIPYALAYGVVAAIIAGFVGSEAVRPHALAAFLAATALSLVVGAFGMLRATELLTPSWLRIPHVIRQALTGGAAGLAVLMACGAGAASFSLAMGFPESVDMMRALDPDPAGGVILALLGAAFVPNLVIWAAAFSTGIGFPLGVDSLVSPRGIDYGPLPVFPPLGAVPPEGDPGILAAAVLLAPLIAGVVTGLIVHRRMARGRPDQVAWSAGGAGLFAGLGLAALCWLSAGGVADGQLSTVGPVGWQVGLVGGIEIGLVAAATAWEAHRRSWDGRTVVGLRHRVTTLRHRQPG